MIEEAIYALLTADSAVVAIITDRLFPIQLPETLDMATAAATYQRISDVPEHTLSDGVVSQTARVQITAWASTMKAATLLALAIRAVLEEFTGDVLSVTIGNAWIAGEMSSFEPDMRLYRVQTDYKLIYSPNN